MGLLRWVWIWGIGAGRLRVGSPWVLDASPGHQGGVGLGVVSLASPEPQARERAASTHRPTTMRLCTNDEMVFTFNMLSPHGP